MRQLVAKCSGRNTWGRSPFGPVGGGPDRISRGPAWVAGPIGPVAGETGHVVDTRRRLGLCGSSSCSTLWSLLAITVRAEAGRRRFKSPRALSRGDPPVVRHCVNDHRKLGALGECHTHAVDADIAVKRQAIGTPD